MIIFIAKLIILIVLGNYDWWRVLRFSLYGGLFVAPTIYGWFKVIFGSVSRIFQLKIFVELNDFNTKIYKLLILKKCNSSISLHNRNPNLKMENKHTIKKILERINVLRQI